jgi:transposase
VGRRATNYPPELRERAVRMVAEVRPDYPSDWPAICAVAAKLGIGSAETLRKWVRQAEVDAGTRPGISSEESAEIRRLKRENAELRRANETSHALNLSSGGLRCGVAGRGEGDVLVVVLPGLEAVVEAAEEPAEQVALGGGVPVASGLAPVVVGPGAG